MYPVTQDLIYIYNYEYTLFDKVHPVNSNPFQTSSNSIFPPQYIHESQIGCQICRNITKVERACSLVSSRNRVTFETILLHNMKMSQHPSLNPNLLIVGQQKELIKN